MVASDASFTWLPSTATHNYYRLVLVQDWSFGFGFKYWCFLRDRQIQFRFF